jgi:hypothetical protein
MRHTIQHKATDLRKCNVSDINVRVWPYLNNTVTAYKCALQVSLAMIVFRFLAAWEEGIQAFMYAVLAERKENIGLHHNNPAE